MIDVKTILAVIPARGGSKGLPGKNILPLAGKPLIVWSIEAAKESKYIDTCIVSTDDDRIATVAEKYGCDVPFLRPEELATDESNSSDAILHALEKLEDRYDIVIILQPTSPLRTTEDIDNALELMIGKHAPIVVSICKSNKPIYWHYTLENNRTIKPVYPSKKIVSNRQEFPATYIPNGALYIAKVDYFKKTKTFYTDKTLGYIMPNERSVDIDSHIDFVLVKALIN